MSRDRKTVRREGGVYIAVLGSAMIIALLGLCALIGQRIENRLVASSKDIRQAQLNANTAIELALLMMKQDTNWRTDYAAGNWFTGRATGAGTCTANVTDPLDGSLSNNPDDPVLITGIGYSGLAQQRMTITVDPKKSPFSCLKSAVVSGGSTTLTGGTLRTNGSITATQISANTAQVYGTVQATSISGSTYNSTTTQISTDKLPTMPDWTSVFNYYKTNGTQIDINALPTSTPNLAQNPSFDNGLNNWTGSPTGIPTADIDLRNDIYHTASNGIRVKNRQAWYAGAAQYIDGFVKSGQSYTVTGYVYLPLSSGVTRNFRFTIYTKGVNGTVQQATGAADTTVVALFWTKVTATITAPAWSGNLEYAFVKIGGDINNTADFYFDDLDIRENINGRFIYRQVLGPGINTLAPGQTNSQGIYWINCSGSRILLERSRIVGTLLIINPGTNSGVNNGPINWSPAVAGFPALLVDSDTGTSADFTLLTTNRVLSEKENGMNYNPSGAPDPDLGTDSDMADIYPSQIRGLIAIRHNLTYQNRTLVRGQVIVGNNIVNSSGELEVDYQLDALLNPPSGFWSYTYPRRTGSTTKAILP